MPGWEIQISFQWLGNGNFVSKRGTKRVFLEKVSNDSNSSKRISGSASQELLLWIWADSAIKQQLENSEAFNG